MCRAAAARDSTSAIPSQVLPFDCCCISFRPFEGAPMCTADGAVFDILNIVPYLKKYRRHPVRAHPRRSDRALARLRHRRRLARR